MKNTSKEVLTSYNGWTNWATWNFKLCLDNDYDTYVAWNIIIEQCNGNLLKVAYALKEYAKSLEENYNNGKRESNGFMEDLSNSESTINDVNYFEVARHVIEDLQ